MEKKDEGARELERREQWDHEVHCASCGKQVEQGSYIWAKTRHGFVFLCCDCARKEGVIK